VKKEAFGVDGAEKVFVAVGEMRRAVEALQVFVVGVDVEKVDREVGAEKDSAAELLPVRAFVDERLQGPVVPVPGTIREVGIDAVVAGDVLEDLFFPIPLGKEKQGVLFPEMGKVDLQVVLPEYLLPALRGCVFRKLRFPFPGVPVNCLSQAQRKEEQQNNGRCSRRARRGARWRGCMGAS